MATWKNLDTLASYSKLAELKGHVNIADAMAGEKGAERVKKYSTPMAAGLTYNYAAKQVDVGYKLAGIPGMLVSVIGAIIPPMVILSVISVFYDAFCSNYYIAALLKGMTAGVGAVIMSVVYDMGKNVVKSKDWVNVVIMIISFCLSYFLNVNIIYIILLVAVFGMVRTIVKGGREK